MSPAAFKVSDVRVTLNGEDVGGFRLGSFVYSALEAIPRLALKRGLGGRRKRHRRTTLAQRPRLSSRQYTVETVNGAPVEPFDLVVSWRKRGW